MYQGVHSEAVSVLSYWFNKALPCKTFVTSFTDMWQVLCMHWMGFWDLEICSGVKMLMNVHPCELTFHNGSGHHLSMWADISQWQCTPPVHVSWPFTMAVHTTCPCELTFHNDSAHHLSMWADLSQWQCTPLVHVSGHFTMTVHTTCPCELTFHTGSAHHLCNSSFVPLAMTLLEVLLLTCSFGFLTVTRQKYLAGTTLSWEWGGCGCDGTLKVQVFCGVVHHDTVLLGKQLWCFTGLPCLYRQSLVVQVKVRHYNPARCWDPVIQQHNITSPRLEPSAVPLWEPQIHWLHTWWETLHAFHKGSLL